MVELLVGIIKTARPRQWVKNFTLFGALIFVGNLLTPAKFWIDFNIVCWGIVNFTLIASSIYFFNDLIDKDADQKHPFKKIGPSPQAKLLRPWLCLCLGLVQSWV